MTQKKLRRLAELADQEPAFTKVSLKNLQNERLIRSQLQAEFNKHFRAKESVQALADRIIKVANASRERAISIAQTERTRALNGSRLARDLEQYFEDYNKAVKNHKKRPEVPEYTWVNPLRAKEPRHEHVAISGTRRQAGEYFLPGLRFPGDPEAPPSQTIRCHCYIRRSN